MTNFLSFFQAGPVKFCDFKPFSSEEKGWDEVKRSIILQKILRFDLTLNPSLDKGEGLFGELNSPAP